MSHNDSIKFLWTSSPSSWTSRVVSNAARISWSQFKAPSSLLSIGVKQRCTSLEIRLLITIFLDIRKWMNKLFEHLKMTYISKKQKLSNQPADLLGPWPAAVGLAAAHHASPSAPRGSPPGRSVGKRSSSYSVWNKQIRFTSVNILQIEECWLK